MNLAQSQQRHLRDTGVNRQKHQFHWSTMLSTHVFMIPVFLVVISLLGSLDAARFSGTRPYPIPLRSSSNKPITSSYSDLIYYWNKEQYPNPLDNPQFCHRNEPSLLCDPDDVLTREQGNEISNQLTQLQNRTECFCEICPKYDPKSPHGGLKVAIALARNIYKAYNTPATESSNTQNFANYLQDRWNYGICEDTVLILVVLARSEIAISLGTTTEKVMPETFFKSIITNNQKLFAQNRIYEALQYILQELQAMSVNKLQYGSNMVSSSRLAPSSVDIDEPQGRTALVVVALIIGFLLIVSLLIGSMMLLKQHYQRDPNLEPAVSTAGGGGDKDPDSPDSIPQGYWNNSKLVALEKKASMRMSSPSSTTQRSIASTIPADYEPCSIDDDDDVGVEKNLS